MDLLLLDKDLQVFDTIDVFESFVWSDKFNSNGDFELTLLANSSLVSEIVKGWYLSLPESEHLMVIEDLAINFDSQISGDKFVAKGRSVETLLNRRVIWNKTVLTGNFQDAILRLLTENVLDPDIVDRTFSNLPFSTSSDSIITALTVDRTFYGEFLYDAIKDLCLSKNIGFRILIDGSDLVCSLYRGEDRSYAQQVNPFIVFSPGNENLLKSSYKTDDASLKTITLVASGSEDTALVTTTVEVNGGAGSDLDRREMFTNATSVQQLPVEGVLTEAEYLTQLDANGDDYFAQLRQLGTEDLAKNVEVESFEGEIDNTSLLHVYGEDFFMGDILQIEDEYGNEGRVQVTELIHSQDINGEKVYPTFTTIL